MTDTRTLVERHWSLANARRWDEFNALLHPDLQYEAPQTREYAEGAVGYLAMFSTWPGDWVATIRDLVCEGPRAVCTIDFTIGSSTETGISVFTFDGGRIRHVTDWWPAPYDPPPRATPLLKRRPA